MKPKKILFVCSASYVFGAEKITLNVIGGLQKYGYRVHCVVSGWNDGQFISELNKMGVSYSVIKLGWLYISKLMWTMDSLIHLPGALLRYRKIATNFKPDITYHYSYRSVFQLRLLLREPVLCNIQDNVSLDKVSRFCMRSISKKVGLFVACSNYIKDDIIRSGVAPGKIKVLYNFISDLKDVTISKTSSESYKNPVLQIGLVGQVIEHKGHETAIETLKQLTLTNTPVQLHIFGSGDATYIHYLKQKAEKLAVDNQVVWHGYKTRQEDIYVGLDLVIVPTLRPEPFGLVAIEPVSFGIPVIAARNGGLQEIIIDGETGLLFEPGNSNDLAGKIRKVSLDRQLLKMFASNALERINKEFTGRVQLPKMDKLIRGLTQ